MNVQKLTQKSIEAIQGAQNLAMDRRNPQVEQEHLLLSLLQQAGPMQEMTAQSQNVDLLIARMYREMDL